MNEFTLTKDQQRAFKRMEKAYKDCIRSGVVFYNNYGTIGALDGKKYQGYSDNDKGVEDVGQNVEYEFIFEGSGEWADDTHYFLSVDLIRF